MMPYVLIAQSIVIIWLLIMLGTTIGGLKKRIDRASRHLEMIDKPEDQKPICGCEHHQCFHDETGCKATQGRYSQDHLDLVECGCLRYVGPEVLPTVLP